MKRRIFGLLCLCLILFSAQSGLADFADDQKEVESIVRQLNDKTIENYETVTIPLKGNPEDFNILPTDDLSTIEFRNGLAEYTFNLSALRESAKRGEKNRQSALERRPDYQLPVYVSDRAVALAYVQKEGDGYSVYSVGSGSLTDRIVHFLESHDENEPYYYVNDSVITGIFAGDLFYDFAVAEGGTAAGRPADIAEILSVYEERVNVGEDVTLGGAEPLGSTGDSNDKSNSQTAWIVPMAAVFALFTAFGIYGARREKSN